MNDNLSFSDFLNNVLKIIDKFSKENSIFNICIQIPNIDLIDIYSDLLDDYPFSSFWEEKNKISYLALGICESLNYDGPDRFKFAKGFNDKIFKKLKYINIHSRSSSFAKLIYFFSFSDNSIKNSSNKRIYSLEAVLPKFLITNDKSNTYLSMNIKFKSDNNIRGLIKEFWKLRNRILSQKTFIYSDISYELNYEKFYNLVDQSNESLSKNVLKGIQLIEDDILQKIVLASRLIFKCDNGFNLINILKNLRVKHPNSCKYVWKRNNKDITFGASPEKLFSFHDNLLTLEAVAGTAPNNIDKKILLQSPKDLLEHNFVKDYLLDCLNDFKINGYKIHKLKVVQFGDVFHLYTQINTFIRGLSPFAFLENLHPSPAVCGIPKKEALFWIEDIETFDRGNYAAPIGWIDSDGNADFRVAIRGARFINNQIEITAGSGIVKGSIYKKEIEEINLKLLIMAKQVFKFNQ
tara:strand:- start:1206 stop:2597 length:1392 start_codon:yes stop_codon:yes gene_type:complete